MRAQLREQRGGADVIFDKNGVRKGGARLLSVVTLKKNGQGRHYRLSTVTDYKAVWKAAKAVERVSKEKLPNGLNLVPDEPLPPNNTNAFRIPNYGLKQWSDVSTSRQKLVLSMLTKNLAQIHADNTTDVKDLLALAISRCSDFNSSHNSWALDGEFVRSTFSRQALGM